ncbi:MAG: FHA domain-containing protein [Actinomycetia bacterium]|nr:FHA domain-containing protein [Actinomycetes bacterium]
MPPQLLTLLKFCLLVLLYLFFLRVLRAVWAEVNGPRSPRSRNRVAAPAGPPAGTGNGTTRRAAKPGRRSKDSPPRLMVLEPAELRGRDYSIGDEITVGRAAGCQITLDDTYVSQLHARVFAREGQFWVEDLGSTNGTYLNRQQVSSAMVVRHGDHLQVGSVVLEVI